VRAPRAKKQGDFIDVILRTWQGRLKRKLLPAKGWKDVEQDLWVLESTEHWIRPLYLQRRATPMGMEYFAFEGKQEVEK
jgi:hypothetical protein